MSMREDLGRFGFAKLPTEDRLRKAFNDIALQHHPDRNGDPEVFDVYRKAYDRILAKINKPIPCKICKGTGKYDVVDGFVPVTQTCHACHGKGSKIKDQRTTNLLRELERLLPDTDAAKIVLQQVRDRLESLQ